MTDKDTISTEEQSVDIPDADDGSSTNDADDADDDATSASRRRRDDRGTRTDRDDRGRGSGRGRSGSWSDAGLYERLQWVALVVLVLVAVATLFSFYTNVSRFIAIWATRKYEPAIQAAFALAVLASSLAGIAALSRNLDRPT
jgi:succinate dehydrogenase hydrophobic anchor subunit